MQSSLLQIKQQTNMELQDKYVKGDERGSHDALQNNHIQLVENSRSSC